MHVRVVYESMYGNTHAIANAIADGARATGADVTVVAVGDAMDGGDGADLLVVGSPTHMHGLTTDMTRRMAARAAEEDGHPLDPSATHGPGLRHWLRRLEHVESGTAAAFDTRGDANAGLTGSAARGIARRLHRHGYAIAGRASFLVDDAEGPLADGELERAKAWGEQLAREATPVA